MRPGHSLSSVLQKQGKRSIDSSTEHGMQHSLRTSGGISKMLNQNRLIIRQDFGCLDLPF